MELSPAVNPAPIARSHPRPCTYMPTFLSRSQPRPCSTYSSFNITSSSMLNGIGCSKRCGNPALTPHPHPHPLPFSIGLKLRFAIGSPGVHAASNSLSILRGLTVPRQLFVCRPSGKEAHLAKITPAPAPSDLGLSC